MIKKVQLILIFVCVAMAFGGIAFYGILQTENNLEENVIINIDGDAHETFKAELTGFYPGKSQEYTIMFTGELAEYYKVTIEFVDDKKNSTLEEYLEVTILTPDKKIEKTLKELLNGGRIDLGVGATEIKLIYHMSEQTGNEAQGTTADFYVSVTATNNQ